MRDYRQLHKADLGVCAAADGGRGSGGETRPVTRQGADVSCVCVCCVPGTCVVFRETKGNCPFIDELLSHMRLENTNKHNTARDHSRANLAGPSALSGFGRPRR